MKTTLSKTTVAKIEPPPTGYRIVWDDQSRGLGLRVTASGVRSWICQRRHRGRTQRLTLARHDELTPAQARSRAAELTGAGGTGSDPTTERRRQQLESLTVAEALDEYLAGRQLKPKTQANVSGAIRHHLADWLDRPVVELTRNDIAERHRLIGQETQSGANGAMRSLRTVLNFIRAAYIDASGASLLQDNVVERLSATRSWFRTNKRTGVLRDHEIGPWLAACDTLPEHQGDYFRLVLLTGLRREEALRLRCEWVDLVDRTLVLPDTKTNRPHSLPLSDAVHELLERRINAAPGPYVFPRPRTPAKPLDPRYPKKLITKRSGIPFLIHDLRRTFGTVAESLDVPAFTIKRLLNHFPGDQTEDYLQIHMGRLREPMQRITDHILGRRCAGLASMENGRSG